ncbi:vesicle transport protein [Pilaira anomala]|nr:vesicle transport protein [Pilaira anomala]
MLTTTDEINLHRLLTSCENKLKQQPIDVWTASEKRKFATYVKYLATLQARTRSSNTLPYSSRIDQLTRAVAVHTMQVDVEKGIAEAKLVKKKHLEELEQLEHPDPEWLLELKKQDEQAELEEAIRKKKQEEHEEEQEEEEEEEEEEEVVEEEKKEPSSAIRQRNIAAKENLDATKETSNIEHVLQHHRQMHDELTTDLGRMAKQLKLNSQAFGDTLSKDDLVLKEAQEAVESNLVSMTRERKRLDQHYSKSWGTSFMTMGVVLFVCIMFILVFFTIKFLPKV